MRISLASTDAAWRILRQRHSRYVLRWELRNTMDRWFLKKNDIQISMDGQGRCIDNVQIERIWRSVKYEDIFLLQYASVSELYAGVTCYFHHDNTQSPDQALGYKTPESIYYAKNQLAKALIIR